MMTSAILAASLVLAMPQQGTLPGDKVTKVQAKVVGPYFLVDVMVNGKPAKFVVDSGAGLTVLNPDAAERLGIKDGIPIKANGAGSKAVDAKLVRFKTLSMGGVEVTNDQAVVLELPEILQCDGLIGYSFLRHFATTFDYSKQTLVFGPSGKHEVLADERELEMKLDANIPLFPGSLDGIKGWYNIDTGANQALTVHRPFIDANKLESKYPKRRKAIVGKGVGGFAYGDKTSVKSFELGGFEFKSVPSSFAGVEGGILSRNTSIGNVGADVLRKFIMTLDYPAKKAYLRMGPLYNDPLSADRAGIFADYQGGRFVVVDVAKGSPGEKAGLKLGDVLTAINGVKTNSVHPLEFGKGLRGKSGTKVKVDFLRNDRAQKTEIVLADF